MNRKSIIALISTVFSFVIILSFSNAYAQEIVSITIDLQTILLEPNQVIPLLDTKSVGNMTKLQISATLPCESNNTPKLKIFAGVLGNLVSVIDSSSDYKNLRGPFDTCYYEGTISPSSSLSTINKVFLNNTGSSSVVTNLGSIITLTGAVGNVTTSSATGLLALQTSYVDTSVYGVALSGTGNSKAGIKVNTDSILIGKTVNTIEFPVIRSGSPTGTYYAEVYASDGSTLKYTFGSGDIATLSSSAVTWKTFTNTGSSYQIAVNDKIVMRFSGGTHATNDLSLKYAESSTGSYDGTATSFCYGNTCQNELTDADAAFKLWYLPS